MRKEERYYDDFIRSTHHHTDLHQRSTSCWSPTSLWGTKAFTLAKSTSTQYFGRSISWRWNLHQALNRKWNFKVLSPQLQPPAVPRSTAKPSNSSSTKDSIDVWGYSTSRPVTHDFNTCCVGKNVSDTCLGFCSLKNILDGTTGADPSTCEVNYWNYWNQHQSI